MSMLRFPSKGNPNVWATPPPQQYQQPYPPQQYPPQQQYPQYPQNQQWTGKKKFEKKPPMSEDYKRQWDQERRQIWSSVFNAMTIGGQIICFSTKGTNYAVVDQEIQHRVWKAAGNFARTRVDAKTKKYDSPFTYGFRPPSFLEPGVLSADSGEFNVWLYHWLCANIYNSDTVYNAIHHALTHQEQTVFAAGRQIFIGQIEASQTGQCPPIDVNLLLNLWTCVRLTPNMTPTDLSKAYESARLGGDQQINALNMLEHMSPFIRDVAFHVQGPQ